MAKNNNQPLNINLFKSIFNLNEEKEKDLTSDDIEYLEELQTELKRFLNEHGEEGAVRIRESVLDALLEDGKQNIIAYFGLEFSQEAVNEIDGKLDDPNFNKIESREDVKDFFKAYLIDETLEDLYFNWKGYIKKNDGNKEIFVKVRKAIIPTRSLNAIYTLLIDNFNKINLLSNKEDEEVGELILLTLDQNMEIISEIPYPCCDTARTVEIMSTMGLKMTNLIGYNKGNKEIILKTIEASYKSLEDKRNKDKQMEMI
jgi:hypothetical protein